MMIKYFVLWIVLVHVMSFDVRRGHHSYVKRGRGEKHEICSRFAKSRGPSIKFGHAKLVRGKKSVQISPPRANDPSHPCTCRYKLIAAAFTVNTAHFTFGDQNHTYILS